jgi:hypothetical protein
LLKLVCGRRPESDPDLASQPTLSHLENAVDRRACERLAHALLAVYLRAREQDGAPTHVLLDIDSTDDPTHGEQQGSTYHGYYRQHMYHPLLIFDGKTGAPHDCDVHAQPRAPQVAGRRPVSQSRATPAASCRSLPRLDIPHARSLPEGGGRD